MASSHRLLAVALLSCCTLHALCLWRPSFCSGQVDETNTCQKFGGFPGWVLEVSTPPWDFVFVERCCAFHVTHALFPRKQPNNQCPCPLPMLTSAAVSVSRFHSMTAPLHLQPYKFLPCPRRMDIGALCFGYADGAVKVPEALRDMYGKNWRFPRPQWIQDLLDKHGGEQFMKCLPRNENRLHARRPSNARQKLLLVEAGHCYNGTLTPC